MNEIETMDQLGGNETTLRTYLTNRFRHSQLASQFEENEIQLL